ncbi:MAG: hypothetical protein V4528_10165 [Pseudomonadota bacterium]
MNQRSLDEAKNADLRGSFQALQRAARRARELAMQTGTAIVISRGGKLEYLIPEVQRIDGLNAQQPPADYGDKA